MVLERRCFVLNLEEAMERNPYNSEKGSFGAYLRYLRYNVDGWYHKTSEDVKEIMKGKINIER